MRFKIRCFKCSGPMWVDDMRDSGKIVDLACIVCGNRVFVNRIKLNKLKESKKREALRRGTLSSQG